jgi:tetratricopeptide (TPR) repeat protein
MAGDFANRTVTHVPANGPAATPVPNPAVNLDSLVPGTTLGGRYEILKMLGEGGMGAVYKARDVEVDRVVALKVIRPEYANRPEILARFRQELVLARQITHKNVIRIFDLGQAEGIRYITMEYVEGQDLYSLLGSAQLPLERRVQIAREICKALEAAHEQGVVHRDLKPQNIMVDNNGRVLVMDFGIARSMEDVGLTHTGALVGTPAFMSPEQAKGEKIDTRTDLFSFGVIFYEMLTGKPPYESETLMGLLLKRVQERPTAPIELDKQIPQALSDIVLKCLAVDREERYQTAAEIIRDFEGWLGDPATFRTELGALTAPSQTLLAGKRIGLSEDGKAIVTPAMKTMAESQTWKWISLSIGAMAVVLASAWGVNRFYLRKPAAPVAPMTVMIADFNNHTGDPVFTGTLESTLKLALEGASFISAYDRTRMRDLGLKATEDMLDAAKAREIAAGEGLNVVISGSLDRRGTGYVIAVRAEQTVTGKEIVADEETAANKDQVLNAVTKLGIAVRRKLGDATSEADQRLSMETLSAASLVAVHEYAAGLNALSTGKFADAQKDEQQAVDLDPNFGMAYTVMASAARNQGRQQDAEKFIKEALKHIDHMTERERYRTRAYLYLLTDEQQKCVDEYGALLERYPSDTGALTNISVCLMRLHSVPKALEDARRAVAILPKRAMYHGNLAMYLAVSGDSQAAAKEAGQALKLGFVNGYLIEAYAGLLQDNVGPAEEAYHTFEKTNPSDAATAFADLAVYEGRYSDAVKILEKGAAADMAGNRPDPDAAATKFWALANVEALRGQKGPALAAAKRALELSKAFQTRFMVARDYVALGETSEAQELAKGLASELPVEPQTYAKLIEGEALLKSGDAHGAVKAFTDANGLLDTWMGRFDLGRAELEAGDFVGADSDFDRCFKRRGEALAMFLDLPTYGYFPPVYYYQGRAREGMKSEGAAEYYKKYWSIRGKAGEDPLLPEVRRRISQ